jgi:hypothetical protein
MSFINAMIKALGEQPHELWGFDGVVNRLNWRYDFNYENYVYWHHYECKYFDLYARPYLDAKRQGQRREPTLYELWLQRPYEG